jgi:hypothetical protein
VDRSKKLSKPKVQIAELNIVEPFSMVGSVKEKTA